LGDLGEERGEKRGNALEVVDLVEELQVGPKKRGEGRGEGERGILPP
jgi:hypothetical protein